MEKTICPVCGDDALEIVYGLPTFDSFEAAERGEVVLGGCLVEDGAPEWSCPNGHLIP